MRSAHHVFPRHDCTGWVMIQHVSEKTQWGCEATQEHRHADSITALCAPTQSLEWGLYLTAVAPGPSPSTKLPSASWNAVYSTCTPKHCTEALSLPDAS